MDKLDIIANLEHFLRQYATSNDDYEIWGTSERPNDVLTLGDLRFAYNKLTTIKD